MPELNSHRRVGGGFDSGTSARYGSQSAFEGFFKLLLTSPIMIFRSDTSQIRKLVQ